MLINVYMCMYIYYKVVMKHIYTAHTHTHTHTNVSVR